MIELLIVIIAIWSVFGILGLGITFFYVIRSQPKEVRLVIPEINAHFKHDTPPVSNERATENYAKLQKYIEEQYKKDKAMRESEEEEKGYSEILFDAVDNILKGGDVE